MLKKIDIYIIKKFLGTYFLSIILIIGIAVMFDITEKMDDFHASKAPFFQIAIHYYLNFIPYFANLFSALFTFISVVFFTSKMAYNTEIVAILASGVSFNRLLRPYIIGACFIGLLTFCLSSYIIPPANKVRLNFEQVYIKNRPLPPTSNMHIELEPGVFVYIYKMDPTGTSGTKFALETFKNKELVSKITAEQIVYDTLDVWTAKKYLKREIHAVGETVSKGDSLVLHLAMSPVEFVNTNKINETMTNQDIRNYIDRQQKRGVGNVTDFIIEINNRYSSPFAALILTLIGVFIASRKVRGGIGIHIMFGFMISFSYILFSRISVSFSTAGTMDPVLSVWLPNIIYSLFAVFLYFKAQK